MNRSQHICSWRIGVREGLAEGRTTSRSGTLDPFFDRKSSVTHRYYTTSL